MIDKERQQLLDYFNGDELAADAWKNKYALKGEKTPGDMFIRLATEFAKAEMKYIDKYRNIDNINDLSDMMNDRVSLFKEYNNDEIYSYLYDKYYNLLNKFKYIIPGGSVMQMLGNNEKIGSLSNCFVIGQPEDSYSGIMLLREEQVHLMKRRGGVGKDLSTLRPSGASVNNAANSSTGAASFMDVDSAITNEVAQDGRRGALMLSLSVNHPDIEEFITKKQDLTKVTGANISVKLTDEFMDAVNNDKDYYLRFPCDLDAKSIEDYGYFEYNHLYKVTVPTSQVLFIKKIKARDLWNKLIHCAWNTAEPGLLFENKHHNYSPDGVYEQYKGVTTNPCGEIFMQPYDSCRLLHINLTSFVRNPFKKGSDFNFDEFYKVCNEAMIMADNLIDLELDAIEKIIEHIINSEGDNSREYEVWKKIYIQTIKGRRCGIGFTGLADTIAMLNLSYNGAAIGMIKEILTEKLLSEFACTIDLAQIKGKFDGFDPNLEFGEYEIQEVRGNRVIKIIPDNIKNKFYKNLYEMFPRLCQKLVKYGRRNVSWSTVAPTGTVSLLAQVSSGIEPVFLPYYMRRKKCMTSTDKVDFVDELGEKYTEYAVIHPLFKKWMMTMCGVNDIENLSKNNLDDYFKSSPWYGSTSNDIHWSERIDIQDAVQKFTTHSISSTINLPKNTTKEDISSIYRYAYFTDYVKGITVYRDTCRNGILVKESNNNNKFTYVSAIKRPKVLNAELHTTIVKGNEYAIAIGLYENKPYEVFVFNSNNNIKPSNNATITKIKKGVYKYEDKENNIIIENLNDNGNNVIERSCALYTSMLLRHGADIKYVNKTAKKIDDSISSFVSAMSRVLSKYIPREELTCPECGGRLIRENGCEKCLDCSMSKCNLIILEENVQEEN